MTLTPATVAIILPAYNEASTIAETIAAFHAQLPEARLVIIDNNSHDGTGAIALQTLQKLNADGEVIVEPRQGKGNALRRAFLEVEADAYVVADADLTYPAYRVNDLLRPILEGRADMVVGDRHSGGHYASENKRPLHNFGNALVQRIVNRLFGASLVDIMSGYRAFSRSFVKTYPILAEGFQIETDMTLHALQRRMRVVEVPVEYQDRPAGSVSKLNTLPDGARVLFTIAQIFRHYRPIVFYAILSVLFGIAGLLAAIPVFRDWFSAGYIAHMGSAVLAAALEIIAFVLLAVGLILDSISHHEKQRAELHYLKIHRRLSVPARSAPATRNADRAESAKPEN